MKINIIMPVYNESAILEKTLKSFVKQTYRPSKLIIVNDNSTDRSQEIIDDFTSKYSFISSVFNSSSENHEPGTKVITAFNKGIKSFNDSPDLLGKFDADIVLPSNYFERMIEIFASDKNIGIAGGNLYIKINDQWKFENISEKTKVRGPIKLYRKECFEQIGGIKKSIGWDTMDELLAQYHGWKVKTDPLLIVKHLKPTGISYSKTSKYKQGEAFYKMRYGFLLSLIASAKLATKKKSLRFFLNSIIGYCQSLRIKEPYVVSEEEGVFIRNHRWKGIKKKLL